MSMYQVKKKGGGGCGALPACKPHTRPPPARLRLLRYRHRPAALGDEVAHRAVQRINAHRHPNQLPVQRLEDLAVLDVQGDKIQLVTPFRKGDLAHDLNLVLGVEDLPGLLRYAARLDEDVHHPAT